MNLALTKKTARRDVYIGLRIPSRLKRQLADMCDVVGVTVTEALEQLIVRELTEFERRGKRGSRTDTEAKGSVRKGHQVHRRKSGDDT